MIVISDTTPLISLIKIGQLNLLNHLFGEVQIPSAVFEELISNPRFPDESRQIRECPFIKKINVTDTNAVNLLRRSTGLDAGESEAIILSDSPLHCFSWMRPKDGRLPHRWAYSLWEPSVYFWLPIMEISCPKIRF